MDPLSIGMCIIVGFISFIVYMLLRNNSYFEIRNVPFIKPDFFYGNVKERLLLKKSFHEFQLEKYFFFKGNPLYGIFEGVTPLLYVTDPDLIKNVLVKDFDHFVDRPIVKFKKLNDYNDKILLFLTGKEWKEVRSAITPAFSSGRLRAMIDIENNCGSQFCKHILKEIENSDGSGKVLDMKVTLGKYTLDVIASTAFGVELDSNSNPDSEFTKKIAKFNDISKSTRLLLLIVLFMQLPKFITHNLPLSFFNLDSMNYLAQVVKDVIKQRQEQHIRRNDFVQLLIDAQKAPLADDNTNTDNEVKHEKEIVLSEEVAIAQAILFFLAGYETSATTLTMTCYELAKNPKIQEKLREEVFNKLEAANNEITYEMINDLPYMDMVISETLRIYPPVSRIERACVKKYKLLNVDIKPGEKVAVPIIGLHMDPDYYPEPDKFMPERFLPEEKKSRHPFVYLPFGAGPRNCIGLRAAQISMKVCLVHFIRAFNVETCDKTKIPFEFHKGSVLLKAKDGVLLKISKYS